MPVGLYGKLMVPKLLMSHISLAIKETSQQHFSFHP